MDNADNVSNWGEKQMETANDRIPYYSTVQISDDEKPSEYEEDVDMSILYEEEPAGNPEKITYLAEKVPISTRFLQLTQDDDPAKIEGMMMEDTNIPLNLRFIQTKME